jgi:hypothetical protein
LDAECGRYWFLPLKIQINSKNQVLEGKIGWGCGNTWANGTGHTSHNYDNFQHVKFIFSQRNVSLFWGLFNDEFDFRVRDSMCDELFGYITKQPFWSALQIEGFIGSFLLRFERFYEIFVVKWVKRNELMLGKYIVYWLIYSMG